MTTPKTLTDRLEAVAELDPTLGRDIRAAHALERQRATAHELVHLALTAVEAVEEVTSRAVDLRDELLAEAHEDPLNGVWCSLVDRCGYSQVEDVLVVLHAYLARVLEGDDRSMESPHDVRERMRYDRRGLPSAAEEFEADAEYAALISDRA